MTASTERTFAVGIEGFTVRVPLAEAELEVELDD